VSVPQPPPRKGAARVYSKALKALLKGHIKEARRIADIWFGIEGVPEVNATSPKLRQKTG
jgi:hypothetical protein